GTLYSFTHVVHCVYLYVMSCFFFSSTPTSAIYTLSLHDALPIWRPAPVWPSFPPRRALPSSPRLRRARPRHRRLRLQLLPSGPPDRKSTRLNSSHVKISYAVFCLK